MLLEYTQNYWDKDQLQWNNQRKDTYFYSEQNVGFFPIYYEPNERYIYPNPFCTETEIFFDNPNNSTYELTIFNLSGNKVVEQTNITTNKIKFDRGNLPNGIYIIELEGDKVFRGKMVIK